MWLKSKHVHDKNHKNTFQIKHFASVKCSPSIVPSKINGFCTLVLSFVFVFCFYKRNYIQDSELKSLAAN